MPKIKEHPNGKATFSEPPTEPQLPSYEAGDLGESSADRVLDALRRKQPNEAIELASRLVAQLPFDPDSHMAMAEALLLGRRFAEALAHARRGVSLDPFNTAALTILGIVLVKTQEYDEAKQILDLALDKAPGACRTHWVRAFANLTLGHLEQGFDDYEYGYIVGGRRMRSTMGRRWRGEPVKSLFIHGEQGLGDQIQFARFIPLAAERAGGEISLEVNSPLVGLLENWADRVWANTGDGAIPVQFDAHVSLLSLPHVLGVTKVDGSPYIQPADLPLELGDAKVAFCWRGNPNNPEDIDRSLTIDEARRLEGAAPFLLLQEEGDSPFECPRLRGTDMAVTASILNQVELVVTVDTSIAHLAGSIGKECWVIPPRDGEWRWGAKGPKTSWYDSIELFRCEGGERTKPIETIRKRLLERFAASPRSI